MNHPVRILSRLALCAALASLASAAHAQQGYGPQYGQPYGQQNQGQGANNADTGDGEGLLPLPQGVSRVVGIDAQNVLLVQMEPEVEGGPSEYRAIPVRHVYVGGIAKLFGGTTISTEEFVSPAFSKGAGFGQNNANGPGDFRGNGNGANGINNNLNHNGYNQNGYNQGFNPNGGYPNGGLPNGGYPNGALPNGYNPNFNGNISGGGFVGSPQISYGVGNFIRSRQIAGQNRSTTSEQGQ